MTADAGIVIVGTGQAAYQLAVSLREEGYEGPVHLVGDEHHLPYQRPPLSKSFLAGDVEAPAVTFQGEAHFEQRGLTLHRGVRVTHIDRASCCIRTETGGTLPYSQLVLATGARNRPMPFRNEAQSGVFSLRSLDDAAAIRRHLAGAKHAVVIGAGFLGLEFAAVAASKGVKVSVVEFSASAMSRVVCSAVGEAFQQHHEALGTRFLFGSTVTRVGAGSDGAVAFVETSTGERLDADIVITSIGVLPNSELARDAELATDNGIVVDARLATRDPRISALGDCAAFPTKHATGLARLESIQNAMDQARFLAKRLTGRIAEQSVYEAVPWFWSDQGGLKLQIAGLSSGADPAATVLRGDCAARSFSAFLFRDGRLVAVESVGRPADHMLARRLIGAGIAVPPELVADASVDLKTLLAAASPTAHATTPA